MQEASYFNRLAKMRSFIRKGNYDAVLSFLATANFICEVSGFPFRKWKLVVGERNANPNILKSVKLRIYRWFHLFADCVVANSSANMEIVRSINPLLSDQKCKVIYNVVDFNRWKPPPDYSPRKSGKLKIIVAASHRPQKNLKGFLEALTLLHVTERSKLMVEWYGDSVAGSTEEAKKIIKANHLEALITLFPATHDITQKTQEADVVGLFSFYEGCPNTVCEGMACGKPVISSAVSDVPGLLSHQSDILCNPKDPQSIRDTISHVLHLSNEELMRIGEQNRIVAKKYFNKQNIVSQYLGLFSK
jgi:glycosyltransferase involved in cell wall biosynthesis